MLHSSNFVRLFHRQSFTLYGNLCDLDLLGLLYHTTKDRKDILADATLLVDHAFDYVSFI